MIDIYPEDGLESLLNWNEKAIKLKREIEVKQKQKESTLEERINGIMYRLL